MDRNSNRTENVFRSGFDPVFGSNFLTSSVRLSTTVDSYQTYVSLRPSVGYSRQPPSQMIRNRGRASQRFSPCTRSVLTFGEGEKDRTMKERTERVEYVCNLTFIFLTLLRHAVDFKASE